MSKELVIEDINIGDINENDLFSYNTTKTINTETEYTNNSEYIEILDENDLEYALNEELPIFYSYPYFSKNEFDYQYRLSFDSDTLTLDEVKCNDSALDNCVSLIKTVACLELNTGLEYITKNIDIRVPFNINSPTFIKYDESLGDILNFDIETLTKDNAEKQLTNNKTLVLIELYNNILQD
jgi:hypothetical protein